MQGHLEWKRGGGVLFNCSVFAHELLNGASITGRPKPPFQRKAQGMQNGKKPGVPFRGATIMADEIAYQTAMREGSDDEAQGG